MHLNIKCFIKIAYLNAEIRKEKGLNKNNKVKQQTGSSHQHLT